MNEITFEGIGTHWWIGGDMNDTIKEEIKNTVNKFENNYSRFKDDSMIGKLNKEKHLENFPEELYDLIKYSDRIKNLTEENFDSTVGSLLVNCGYDKDYSFESKNIKDMKREIKFSKDFIEIGEETIIDLGGAGKGWLIDKIKNLLLKNNIKEFYINGGGDIFNQTNKPQRFHLENPFNQHESIGYIDLTVGAIACSAGNKRSWKDKKTNLDFHHLISANSQKSVNEIVAVFTQAKDALSADSASTAIFVSPLTLTEKIAKELEVEYLIIFPGGEYFKSSNYNGVLNS